MYLKKKLLVGLIRNCIIDGNAEPSPLPHYFDNGVLHKIHNLTSNMPVFALEIKEAIMPALMRHHQAAPTVRPAFTISLNTSSPHALNPDLGDRRFAVLAGTGGAS